MPKTNQARSKTKKGSPNIKGQAEEIYFVVVQKKKKVEGKLGLIQNKKKVA